MAGFLHATCTLCQTPIYWGETLVSILRNVERLEESDSMIHTEDSDQLASLCAKCGARFPADSIQIHFKGIDRTV